MLGPGRHTVLLLRRLAFLPLSLLVLTLICFTLNQLSSVDPVRRQMSAEGLRVTERDPVAYERRYQLEAERIGYDRPPFYLTLTNASLPDTLYRILQPERRDAVRALASRYGNWPAVQAYYRIVRRLALDREVPETRIAAASRKLLTRSAPEEIEKLLAPLVGEEAIALRTAFRNLEASARPSRVLIPRLYWYGAENRYHAYVLSLLRGDLGLSYVDRRPVSDKVATALPSTLLLNGIALTLVYLISVPLGLYMAYYEGSRFDRWLTVLIFIAFGIPSFWVATLLANFLTTPAFGLDFFPSMGFGRVAEGASLMTSLRVWLSHLFLPVLCLTYPSLAYVARHLRSAAIKELHKPYIRTARMKGLAGAQVLWGHVFRNASFPLVTLFGSLLPALLAGSILIEQIFNLPGMGLLLYNGALARDWPVVTALVLINGLLTIVGLVLADVGYVLLDPRLRGTKGRYS